MAHALSIPQSEVAPPLLDDGVVSAIVERHANAVWRFLRYMGVPESDLPDASQDVFLVVHRRRVDFDASARVETWLYGICLRVAANRRRTRRRKPEVALVEDRAVDSHDGAELSRRHASRDLLVRALAQLPEDQRTVFILAEVEELSMREVARIAACPLFTAYSRRRLAKKRLRAIIEEMEGDHG